MKRVLAALLASAALLAACGGSDSSPGPEPADDPKGALSAALEALGDYEGITAELSLSSDVASLVAASEGDMTDDQAQTILDSSLRFTAVEGETPEDSQVEMVADVAGDLVELRVLGTDLYVRADVRELVERFGGSSGDVDKAMSEAPPQFSFLKAGAEGEWIKLEGADELAKQFGGAPQDQEEAEKIQKELATKLGAAVDENSTVEHVGSDDIGEHLEVQLAVRPLAEAFMEVLQSVPGGEAIPADAFDPSQVPDTQLPLDVWIADGRVRQIEADIIKIAEAFDADPPPDGVEKLGLVITLEEFTGGIEAPDPAETVNLGELMQMFMGGFGMGAGAPTETEMPDMAELCRQLEGQPAEVTSQFAEECPELQQ